MSAHTAERVRAARHRRIVALLAGEEGRWITYERIRCAAGRGDSPAEGVGFEPTRDFHPCRFSSSTESRPPVSIPSNPLP
jgi:hypothetical protein